MNNKILNIGRVVEVSGTKLVCVLDGTVDDLHRTYKSRHYAVGQVGSIVKVEAGDKLVFGIVVALRMTESLENQKTTHRTGSNIGDARWLEIELFGEALRTGLGERDFEFERGVITYPLPGQDVFVASLDELANIYQKPNKPSVCIGTLSQATLLPVFLNMDDLLGKHFAILGTTGAGKSCSVAVLLNSILSATPKAHIILLDPHNEYQKAFSDRAETIDPTTINLPHWLMNFEESTELFIGRTERAATSQTNILKDAMLEARQKFIDTGLESENITVDTPVPYKLSDLVDKIESSKPQGKTGQDPYLKLVNKIRTLQEDSRFSFLFHPDEDVSDNLANILSKYLRIPVSEKPLSIIDLSGVPSDVVDVVVSLLCRMVFNFAIWSSRPVQVPIALICEEAHRYAPRGEEAGFKPTRQALSRIAREGRKYGVSLGLVSQRPSELSESILSQCNTLIALRMSNERDQSFVRHASPDSVQSLLNALSTLRTQEALVVGEGTVVPVRVRFRDLAEKDRPQSSDVPFAEHWSEDTINLSYVEEVVKRWRLQERPE